MGKKNIETLSQCRLNITRSPFSANFAPRAACPSVDFLPSEKAFVSMKIYNQRAERLCSILLVEISIIFNDK